MVKNVKPYCVCRDLHENVPQRREAVILVFSCQVLFSGSKRVVNWVFGFSSVPQNVLCSHSYTMPLFYCVRPHPPKGVGVGARRKLCYKVGAGGVPTVRQTMTPRVRTRATNYSDDGVLVETYGSRAARPGIDDVDEFTLDLDADCSVDYSRDRDAEPGSILDERL